MMMMMRMMHRRRLVPGHGGFLDPLDSVLTGAAVVATYIVWFVR